MATVLHGERPRRKTRRGELEVVHASFSVIRTRLAGRFDRELAAALIDVLERWLRTSAKTSLVAFHDCEQIVDYDVDARELLTRWSRERMSRFAGIHLLVRGRVIAWGVRLLRAMLGGIIVAHDERATFEAAFATHSSGAVGATTRFDRR